ncbi:MAG: ribosome hibernation-promoting factor, HPF/YfiA family [Vicinamibacteria bacterium]
MNIHITGRHIDVTDAQRQLIESKLSKLGRFIDGITDIHVTLSVEKYRQRAEVQVHSRGNTYLTAAEESEDLYSSIQQVIEKVQAQARKHSDKRVRKKRRAARREDAGTFNVLAARESGNAGGLEPGMMDDEGIGPRVVETQSFVIKPLSVEEAVAEIDGGAAEFLVFRNALNERVNVIYRRRDGNYGLIDPGGQ